MKIMNNYVIIALVAALISAPLCAMERVDANPGRQARLAMPVETSENQPPCKPRKARPKGPSVSPLLRAVLVDETVKDQTRIVEQLKTELPAKLDRLYQESLPQDIDESDRDTFLELQNEAYNHFTAFKKRKFHVAKFIPFDEFKPIINQFREANGFRGKLNIFILPLGDLARCYATYMALSTALADINKRIGLK